VSWRDKSAPLRLMLYDRMCRGPGLSLGLSHAWSAGGVLYNILGRLDAWHGAATWAEGLDWLLEVSEDRPIAEIQFWGHGEWGGLWIDEERLTAAALAPGHPAYERLARLKARLVPGGEAMWWFRSCDVFGTQRGHDFARAWTRFFECRAAGHTHQIMFFQSGLHVLAPGEEPTWSVDEGVVPGLFHASSSSFRAPHTITCLHNVVPDR
jgi:hypothetical protein